MRGSVLSLTTETASASVCHKGASTQRAQGSEGTNVVRSNRKPYRNFKHNQTFIERREVQRQLLPCCTKPAYCSVNK